MSDSVELTHATVTKPSLIPSKKCEIQPKFHGHLFQGKILVMWPIMWLIFTHGGMDKEKKWKIG